MNPQQATAYLQRYSIWHSYVDQLDTDTMTGVVQSSIERREHKAHEEVKAMACDLLVEFMASEAMKVIA